MKTQLLKLPIKYILKYNRNNWKLHGLLTPKTNVVNWISIKDHNKNYELTYKLIIAKTKF